MLAYEELFGITPADSVLCSIPFLFESTFNGLLPALCNGAVSRVPGGHTAGRTAEFIDDCRLLGPTVLSLPVDLWEEVCDHLGPLDELLPSSVRLVLVTRDQLAAERLRSPLRSAETNPTVAYTYGPPECSALAAVAVASSDETREEVAVVGRPIPRCSVFVADEEGRQQKPGLVGELCVGGACVARGYWGERGMTRSPAASRQFVGGVSGRVFRTGCLASSRHDGEIVYRGRAEFRSTPGTPEGALIERSVLQCDELEARLCAIWERLLKRSPIGPLDDFFDVGGSSLLALRLLFEVNREFGVRCGAKQVFQNRTIRDLAILVRDAQHQTAAVDGRGLRVRPGDDHGG